MAPNQNFILPGLVFGSVEVRRLIRELQALDDYMHQADLREAGAKQQSLPKLSRLLDTLASENQINLLQEEGRLQLAQFLQDVNSQAPVVHLSFASDPSSAFMLKIVSWLRENIHPLTLVRLGLQPTLAAGCILRTTNRVYDFSLRHRFDEQRKLLIDSLEKS